MQRVVTSESGVQLFGIRFNKAVGSHAREAPALPARSLAVCLQWHGHSAATSEVGGRPSARDIFGARIFSDVLSHPPCVETDTFNFESTSSTCATHDLLRY